MTNDIVNRLLRRTLPEHGGHDDIMNGWNLTDNDSELHSDAIAEIRRQSSEIDRLQKNIADIGSSMQTKAINNPNGVKASTLEMLANELVSVLPNS